MNHDAPRQLESGLWHYTRERDGAVWPIGNCATLTTCKSCTDGCSECKGTCVVPVNEPCKGHNNREEACNHYKEYLLSLVKFVSTESEENCIVHGCNSTACCRVDIPGRIFDLCKEHANLEAVSKMVFVDECFHSQDYL